MWEFSLVDRVVFEIIKSDTYFEFISVFVSFNEFIRNQGNFTATGPERIGTVLWGLLQESIF